MRINANSIIDTHDVAAAVSRARNEYGQDIYLDEVTVGEKGAINFYCASVSGRYSVNRRGRTNARAASWTAWGYVIATLFSIDPWAHIGQYKGMSDFVTKIGEARATHMRRRGMGINKEGEPGQNCHFLTLLSWPEGNMYQARSYDGA